jgi:prolyl oligopeptidase
MNIKYPETYRDTSVVDVYFDTSVPDPYRWLEDDNSAATEKWVQAQRSITGQFFQNIPFRDALKQRLNRLWDYERYGVPVRRQGKLYLLKNEGLQEQDVLCELLETSAGPSFKEVLNPNRLSQDNTISLGTFSFSRDGSLLAYQLSEGGSDWRTIYIQDLETNAPLQDRIEWVKFSEISWYKDGFFYSRFPEPIAGDRLSGANNFHQVYYHRVGTSQEDDRLVFAEHTSPNRTFETFVSDDENYLFLSAAESTSGNALYYQDLSRNEVDFTPIIETFDHDFEVIGTTRGSFLVLTNYKAPRQRVVRINITRPEERYWEEIIPESEDILREVHLFNNKLAAHYLHNVSSQVKVFDLNGKQAGALTLPDIGSVTEFSGSPSEAFAYFGFTSFTQPETIYQLDLENLTVSRFLSPAIDFDAGAYETRQVWYQSYDGTRIPMFIIQKQGFQPNGAAPTLLYGYGGFDIPVLPIFNRTRLNLFPIILENNGICAVANIRGGGEFGSQWHEAGIKLNKQRGFDDFQAAAEYLIANQYTNPKKLAVYGRSNGGLLVGASLVQRPDLYAVAIPAVGVLDMLRYHKFTIGWAWASDYGASEQEEEFESLYSYSPLHNIIDAQYPATLITTADHDDRVVPAHSFKFGATLQAHQKGDAPVLIRIEENTGHGAGAPVSKSIDEGADVLSFIFYNMKQEIVYDYQ